MKLVETEYEHVADLDVDVEAVTLPRPERRRVHLSLIVTLAVLVATVTTIYLVFPPRVDTLQDAAIDFQLEPGEFDLIEPSQIELEAWSVGLVGPGVPWPPLEGRIVGAQSIKVLHRRTAAVRVRVGEGYATLFATRAVEAPPRTRRKKRDDLFCVSYRRGHWMLVAAGPQESAPEWLHVLGAPGGKAPQK